MAVTAIEEILLSQVSQRCTDSIGDLWVIVDDQGDAIPLADGQEIFRYLSNSVRGPIFGAELDKVGTPFAEAPGDIRWGSAAEVCGIDEGVEAAVRKRFHG